ncbi:CLUMA_CG015397, isoform A [Clunio marinus]|uniref:CLUMA_CG015397, isoform A n=1 Tax=Clunio marinus TaxID=568069 RepID=A0A1J1IRR9_9DIPT|nr:CLUMA_CG015397, isoform A [Clunio marinus]
MTESVATSQMATLPSTSSYSNIITAEIRVENLSASPVEQSASISIPTSSQTADNNVSSDEPEKKRQKLDIGSLKVKKLEKLENRLGGILCCAVCLDLPRAAMYQCQLGHLMCAGCFTHLLADGRLRDQVATCPNCRVEISKNNASRNLAVEKAVSELPSECQFCSQEFPRSSLDHHERNECEERPTECKYSIIGCQWNGPTHEAKEHEASCAHPKKSGADVMAALEDREARYNEEKKLFSCLVDLLSYEKITFNDKNSVTRCQNVIKTIKNSIKKKKKRRKGQLTASPSVHPTTPATNSTNSVSSTTVPSTEKLKPHIDDLRKFLRQFLKKSFSMTDLQMKPYRTDEYVHKLFYETTRFSAFNHQWIVKAIINNSQRDVHQSNDRQITYQVTLKSKTQYPLAIHFFVLPGPFSDMKVNTKIYKHDFTDNENESAFNLLPLPDTAEANRLLAAKTINFRLIMFLASN